MAIFWRARDTESGRELKFRSTGIDLMPFEQMAAWVRKFYRNLELIEVAPWDWPTHNGVFYPVPANHVTPFTVDEQGNLVPTKPQALPEPKRRSLLISGRNLLRST